MKNLGRKYNTIYDVDIDIEIKNYVDNLKKLQIKSVEDLYHLPLSNTIINFYHAKDSFLEGNEDDKIRNIGNFLNDFSRLYDAGLRIDRASSASDSSQKHSTAFGGRVDESQTEIPKERLQNLGTDNDEDYLDDLKEVTDELKKLFDAVLNYYIIPMESQYIPFDDNFAFDATESTFRVIKAIAGHKSTSDKDDAFFRLMRMSKTARTTLVNGSHIEKFTILLKELTKPSNFKNIEELKRSIITNGIKPTVLILKITKKNIILDDVHEEFGSFFYQILLDNERYDDYLEIETRNNNPEGKFPNKNSKHTPKELYEKREKGRKNYPFASIVKHIKRNRFTYETQLGKLKGENRASTIISEFTNALDDMNIIKSQPELNILSVHDTIRKMMNKPVYYNTSKLDNFEHINTAIDIMKNNYNVDVTANEIFLIVNEVNALGEISIKHGVPKESVYFLKANFR